MSAPAGVVMARAKRKGVRVTVEQLQRLYPPARRVAVIRERLGVEWGKARRIEAGELLQCEATLSQRWGGRQCERWTDYFDPVAGGWRCPRHETG